MGGVRLSMAFAEMSGPLGDGFLARGRTGTVMRRRPRAKRKSTPAQREAEERMTAASRLWDTLSPPEAQAWREYAARFPRLHPITGQRYVSTGYNAFMELAMRALQATPEGEPPLSPPLTDFTEDGVAYEGRGEPGGLVWTASGPNRADVTVELLIQALPNGRRLPGKQYKSAGFTRFEAGSLEASLPVPPGWYALATRELDATTGQAGGLAPIGVVEAF